MKIKQLLRGLIFVVYSTYVFPQGILDQIKIDTLKKYVKELSGYYSITLQGNSFFIESRNAISQSSNIDIAAAYIKSKLEYFGLPAYEQPFTFNVKFDLINAKNIYAIQTGKKYPDKKYIICGHYDDVPYTGSAPGADDNASGTAVVLEAARIISKINTDYTIIYAFWSGEEEGLQGSHVYARMAQMNNEDILGVVNVDMVSWDGNNNNEVAIYYKEISNEKQYLMDKLISVVSGINQIYGIGITVLKSNTTSPFSDHYAFLQRGFPAFCIIENNGNNPNYHRETDVVTTFNSNFYEKCSKLAICTLAELAQTSNALGFEKIKTVPSNFALNQNYPNPFNPSTVISYRLANAGYVKLVVFDALGREVKTLVDEYQSAGEHNAQFTVSGKALTSGVYFYKLQAGNRFLTKKMVYLK